MQIDFSTEADVRKYVGAPANTTTGVISTNSPVSKVLNYDCSGTVCATSFFINEQTKKLAGFTTAASSYQTAAGTMVGMTEAVAAHQEGKASVAGCSPGIMFGGSNRTPRLFIEVGTKANHIVKRIMAESTQNPVGVFSC